MAIELFLVNGSPYAWRVQLALELKGVPYTVTRLGIADGSLATPEFRALSPRGKVPTVRDGAYVLTESLAILGYLDEKFPEPPLFGTTAEETGAILRVASEYGAYVDHAVEAFILPMYFGRATEEADRVRDAAATLTRELQRYEAVLAASPYLAGPGLTADDLVVSTHVQSILRSSLLQPAH